MSNLNPIQSVDGVSVLTPSTYKYSLQDISASDAGRTEDTMMHKKKIGQCVKLSLEWSYLTTAECSALLQAFNPEYVTVNYLDAKEGGYKISEFYVGDRTAPLYNATSGLWSNVAFDLIERSGK